MRWTTRKKIFKGKEWVQREKLTNGKIAALNFVLYGEKEFDKHATGNPVWFLQGKFNQQQTHLESSKEKFLYLFTFWYAAEKEHYVLA